jgi:hypothetical protein
MQQNTRLVVAPNIKRLVDLVDRGPEDDLFYPSSSNNSIFRREYDPYHNMVPEIVEIGYQGNASWGQRITVNLTRKDSGDLLQWICLRLRPQSWLGALEGKILSGKWDYQDVNGAWKWASSLGTAAIQLVEFEIGDSLVESWPGEWMDIWSRMWMEGGRSGTWDADIYGKIPPVTSRDTTRIPWTTVLPTEDGYVYCWLPICLMRRSTTAFPLIAMGEQEVRVHITLRPFADVVRRRAIPRISPCEVPLGETITLLDKTGVTPIPRTYTLPTVTPGFDDVTVFVGVVHTEDPLRSSYLRTPMELMYEPVKYARFDLPDAVTVASSTPITMNFPLRELNGPIREIAFFLRRKAVWKYNEWTNYSAYLEGEQYPVNFENTYGFVDKQQPILVSAKLMVGNAVWRDETENWWRLEYGLNHRGGVRLTDGFVYGFVLGDAANWQAEDLQPAATVNASRTDMRLTLTMQAPTPIDEIKVFDGWEVHVFGIGLNWMRFVKGMAVPLFKD